MVHTPREDFPYHGTALAVHLARGISITLGAATVLLTYLISLSIFPNHKWLATGAASIVAFNPQFLFISASINNDNLVTFAGALGIWFLLQLWRGNLSDQTAITSGLILGIAALSKLNGLGLIPMALVAAAVGARRAGGTRPFLRVASLIAGVTAAVAGWWYVRNWILYGDPLGLQAHFIHRPARPQGPGVEELPAYIEGVWKSTWAVFGWFNVVPEDWVYVLFTVITVTGLLGLVSLGIRRRVESTMPKEPQLASLILLGTWTSVMVAALVAWSQLRYPQGRILFPALPSAAVLMAVGLASWTGFPRAHRILAPVGATMFVVAAFLLLGTLAPAYATPPVLPTGEAVEIPNPVAINYGDQIELLGYELDDRGVDPGESFGITLYWRARQAMDQPYSVYIHLRTPEGLLIAQRDSYPGRGNYPTFLWEPGDVVVDRHRVQIPVTATAPEVGRIEVGLYSTEDMVRLPAYGSDGEAITPILGLFRVRGPELVEADVPNPLALPFSDQIALVGWEGDALTLGAGETLTLTLYWKALNRLETDYHVFVHLVEAPGGSPIAQADSQPQSGRFPTSLWDLGETVSDPHRLNIPPDLPPGDYRILLGVYDLGTGTRLKTDRGEDQVDLTTVRVIQP